MQSEIDRIQWYHDFEFPGGLVASTDTPDKGFHRDVWAFIERNLDTIDFEGKTVLDVGCWDGYWSFYAERKGARSVLASDDISQNWADGEGLRLAKRLLKSEIEVDQQRSVYDLQALGQTFDVIMCLGVYYHLHDPFYAFSQIRHCCTPDSVVVFEGDVTRAFESPTAKYVFDDTSRPIFVPSVDLLEDMLASAYLEVVHADYLSGSPDVPLGKRIKRVVQFLANKSQDPAFDRSVVICRPITGKNETHEMKPPFGLHVYDERW